MRLSKKVLLVSLVLVLAAGMVFAGGSKDTAKKQGKVLTIYCWNDEFQTRFNDYFAAKGLVPDGIEVNWVITPNQGNAYQDKLDEALLRQNSASERDIIDIFLVEAD
ncbi:MAG TPA: carbohydrate ABC transporter substrate-binding protein, partial [Treponemataceae bacterium]|nr:carbohydrate ABC transporter substrate-binding protein [Treponemataceae bacterium]